MSRGRGNLGGLSAPLKCIGSQKNGRTYRDAVWGTDSFGTRKHVLDRGQGTDASIRRLEWSQDRYATFRQNSLTTYCNSFNRLGSKL